MRGFRAYSEIEFLAPVYAGDFIEVVAMPVGLGETSRQMEFEARKVIAAAPECGLTSAFVLEKPLIVCRAKGTYVLLRETSRKLKCNLYNMLL